MGVNYYEASTATPDGRCLHIGKSSGGWCFALHVYPVTGIRTLQDWIHRLRASGLEYPVVDCEDHKLTLAEFSHIVVSRAWDACPDDLPQDFYLKTGQCVAGPNNLIRAAIDGVHCIGHGEGTWDYIATDFR